MKSNNPELQKVIVDLQERNRQAQEWQSNFAEKIILKKKTRRKVRRKENENTR